MKRRVRKALAFLVCGNTALFLLLAAFHQLSTTPRAAVFIDFWGRFTVYSLWFIGYSLYRRLLADQPLARRLVIVVVCANIPLFLLLAWLDKISNGPEYLVFIDFWGRVTVYSLWFICYEFYREHLQDEVPHEAWAGPVLAEMARADR